MKGICEASGKAATTQWYTTYSPSETRRNPQESKATTTIVVSFIQKPLPKMHKR